MFVAPVLGGWRRTARVVLCRRLATPDASSGVRHDEQSRRFVHRGALDAFVEYETLDDGAMDLLHTYVAPEHRGKGYAAQLASAALGYAREHNVRVVPTCSYIDLYIRRHPEMGDLVRGGEHR